MLAQRGTLCAAGGHVEGRREQAKQADDSGAQKGQANAV
jgi:hypothetical protein